MSVHCCRAFRAKVNESVHGPYLGPNNKYYNILICAFVSVHHHRPSAQEATPPQGVAESPMTENWCPIWGLWLVADNPEAQQQQAACQLADG